MKTVYLLQKIRSIVCEGDTILESHIIEDLSDFFEKLGDDVELTNYKSQFTGIEMQWVTVYENHDTVISWFITPLTFNEKGKWDYPEIKQQNEAYE